MTNIMAFNITENGRKSAYICTDSQSTGDFGKVPVQKIYIRGYRDIDRENAIAGNLIAPTGLYGPVVPTMRKLLDKCPADPEFVAKELLSITGDFGLRKSNKRHRLTYFVVGLQGDNAIIYEVDAVGHDLGKPAYREVDGFVFSGSGSRKTGPAIERDAEIGTLSVPDRAEGVAFCFSFGNKADEDKYVDNRLQLGFVSGDGARLLYHPQTPFSSDTERFLYYRTAFGTKLSKAGEEQLDHFGSMGALLNDLYTALAINCSKFEFFDRSANRAHAFSKTEQAEREKHEAKRIELIGQRDAVKTDIASLNDAWLSGNAHRMACAMIEHHKQRLARYGEATDLIEQLNAQ